MKILVIGGAGYIGSHMVKSLHENGHDVVTLDDLSTGFRDAVHYGSFVRGSIGDKALLQGLFREHSFDSVMHFASFIQVGESVAKPAMYYENNVSNTLVLLTAMVQANVSSLVFSSTAAIFGEPEYIPIDEKHPRRPVNPYGHSKLMVEQILRDFDQAYGLRSICLRYFNAAGAAKNGLLGERHEPETHLIPLVLRAADGTRESISVFGQDYDTPDGTCIRDYIHVEDLCDAHLLALDSLANGGASDAYNLGNGQGFSVREVINVAKQVTQRNIRVNDAERRAGDPARLVADSARIVAKLGWKPKFPGLKEIVGHAWSWQMKHSQNS